MTLDPRRKGRITGSVAGAILGLNPWRDADDVLRAMVRQYHGAEREFTGNVATEYGTFQESGAVAEFEIEHGLDVKDSQFYMIDEWLGATPDGEVGDDAIIEIKCPYGLRKKDKPEFKTIEQQHHYYAQLQLEMAASGRTKAYFYQWAPKGTSLEIVPLNKAWLADNVPKLRSFYERYLSELDNPAHLEPLRKEVESPKAKALLDEYDDLVEAIERATERKKEVLAALVDMAGERDALICGRKLTRVERAGSIGYAKVVKDHLPDIDLEGYRGKASASWRLS